MSPESPEPDAIEYNLTPRTEAKYTKIDEEFQMMMQRHQHNGSRVNIQCQMSIGFQFYTGRLTSGRHTENIQVDSKSIEASIISEL